MQAAERIDLDAARARSDDRVGAARARAQRRSRFRRRFAGRVRRRRSVPAARDAEQPARQRDALHAARRTGDGARDAAARRARCSRSKTTGPAFPEAERARVFERFYRVLGTGAEGCGLGLAIVREIAQSHARRSAARRPPPTASARSCASSSAVSRRRRRWRRRHVRWTVEAALSRQRRAASARARARIFLLLQRPHLRVGAAARRAARGACRARRCGRGPSRGSRRRP